MSEQDRNRPGNGSKDPLDDFWDIEHLMPARPSRPVPPRNRPAPAAVEIELDAPRSPSPAREGGSASAARSNAAVPLTHHAPGAEHPSDTHYVPPHTADEGKGDVPLLDYHPDGILLRRVQIYEWVSGFHYFDQFAKDAAVYAAKEAPTEARRESFFSYFPQYVQLTKRQADYYLWWRGQVQSGVFPDTDYAYILLYLFEIINLEVEGEAARRNRDRMAATWMAYRRAYPHLDRCMCEWLCDYCLIHRLPAPVDILAPALDAIIAGSKLKEFYLTSAISVEDAPDDAHNLATARILMRHCCQYDYRKSKFAEGEHKALFDKTIPAAVASVLPLLLGDGGHAPAIVMEDSTVTRDAYTGALCSYRFKRKITVSYTSFSRSHDLRFLMGDMVKHVENRLRSWIGVRSRLSVMSLPIPLRDALDAYLNPIAPPKASTPAKTKEPVRPAYESLYDLPRKELSLSDADAIEARSWETTKILTEAFGENSEFGIRNSELTDAPQSSPCTAKESNAFVAPVSAENPMQADATSPAIPHSAFCVPHSPAIPHLDFLRAALRGDREGQRAYAARVRKMPDALADEINAATAEGEIGDIVLEDDGTGLYAVVEDYRPLLQSM